MVFNVFSTLISHIIFVIKRLICTSQNNLSDNLKIKVVLKTKIQISVSLPIQGKKLL